MLHPAYATSSTCSPTGPTLDAAIGTPSVITSTTATATATAAETAAPAS